MCDLGDCFIWRHEDGLNSHNEKLESKQDRLIDARLAASIQDAVWTVVSMHPLAGVRTDSSRQE